MAKSGMIGAKRHINRLRKIQGQAMVREVGAALFAAGELVQVEAQISISAGSISGAKHVPSAPGQAPNQDSGVLAGNIETNQIAPLVVEVSSNAPYAAPLEFGTSRMAARPYMAPARDAKKAEAVQIVRRSVDRVIKRSGNNAG